MDKKIAMMLAEIQLCSDVGKSIDVIKEQRGWKAEAASDYYELSRLVGETRRHSALHGGYARKDELLNTVCGIIARKQSTGFRFWVSKDKKGMDVLYFQWKLEDGKHQCSFHRPEGVPQWKKGCKNSLSRWDAGEGSRKELIKLLKSL